MSYDIEVGVRELHALRATGGPEVAEIARIAANAADAAIADLWPNDSAAAEHAGLGAIAAAATFGRFATTGECGVIVNAIGMFGLALVERGRESR